MLRFVLLLAVVAIGSYYVARTLLEGWPRRHDHPARREEVYVRPFGPDDDDEFLAELSQRNKRPDEPS